MDGKDTSTFSSSSVQSELEEDMMMELRRGPWTIEEDLALINYIANHGEGRWNSQLICLNRTGKSCRLRWFNHLRPDVRRGNITLEEQLLILELHSRWGNRWSKIAQHLPGRTDNEIKNYWRTRVQKHAKQLKCDVNSKQFKDTMRCLWMPRLVERIQAASAAGAGTSGSSASTSTTNNNNINSFSSGQVGLPPASHIGTDFGGEIEIEKESATQNRNLVIIEKITNVLLNLPSYWPDFLVQFWALSVTTTGGRCFLATSDQPFGITRYHEGLCAFRKLSMECRFYVDTTDEKDFGGLIRRAFMQKSQSLYPDLQCCSNKEYPQLDQLVQCKIKGFATLPVLEPSSMGCVGVFEILSTADTIWGLNFNTNNICGQLEFVGLKLSDNVCLNPEVASSDQEWIEELYAEVINSSTEKNFDNYQIDLATESPPRTHDLLNGGALQLAVEDDTINNGNDVISAGKSYITATDLVKEGKIKPTTREHRKNETSISYEVVKGHFGMKLEDAAEKLDVSRSTLKRLCRQNGVPRWPSHKRKKVNHPLSNQDPSSSNPPTDQAIQDGRIATIKAEYGDDIIKFKLSFSSRMRDLEEEVGKRLKLENGTFKIKYVDGDGDRILIACDADLNDCIHFLTSSGITTIKMFVELGALS